MAIASDTQHSSSQTSQHRTTKSPMFKITHAPDRRLGELLCDSGTLTEQDYKRILAAQLEHGERFKDVAVRLGLVTERDVRLALAKQCELPAVLADAATYDRNVVVAHQPFSARSEALRSLRSELMLRWFSPNRRVLAIAEARHQQGATALAANVAWLCAQLGQRTLVIDANLRQPQLHKLLKLNSTHGLVDFLKGVSNVEDGFVSMPGFNHLTALFAGKPPNNPQELLSLESFGYLLDIAISRFDIVIVVGPPLLEFSDMKIIAAHTGGCMLVAQRHRTKLEDVQHAKSQLAHMTEFVGVALDG